MWLCLTELFEIELFLTLKLYLQLTELLHITAWIVWNRNVFDKLCTYAKLNCFK